MQILYFFQSIRFPLLDKIMLAVTTLGEETAFLVLALIFFWCVDKKKGYFIMAVGFMGTIISQVMKMLFRVPRPWEIDPDFEVVGNAKEAAGGYSFPSGHSQSAVGVLGSIAASTRKKWLMTVCIVFMVLVPVSRMYLGVHTLSDVLVGSGLSLGLIAIAKPVIWGKSEKGMKILVAVMLAMSVLQVLFVEFYPFPADMDAYNLEHGTENAYTLLGCLIGVALVYTVDSKWLNFKVDAVWWAQILKAVGGLAVVLAVKEGMRVPLNALFSGHLAARAVRYFLIVTVAGIVWPMTFRWFSRLGHREEKA